MHHYRNKNSIRAHGFKSVVMICPVTGITFILSSGTPLYLRSRKKRAANQQ
jgi:hypothetical protein